MLLTSWFFGNRDMNALAFGVLAAALRKLLSTFLHFRQSEDEADNLASTSALQIWHDVRRATIGNADMRRSEPGYFEHG